LEARNFAGWEKSARRKGCCIVGANRGKEEGTVVKLEEFAGEKIVLRLYIFAF
jgi:hypothetical protein